MHTRGLPLLLNFKKGHALNRKTINGVSERGFGIRSREKKKTYMCIFFVAFIPTLMSNQPPVQWKHGALLPGKKESGRCVTSINSHVFRGKCLLKQRDYCNRLTH